ncbi:DUF6279 family lipoprotein [Marinobacter sp. LN3S78]|uniref:DUF6279 family lipoprotein n=1 Tax=Marinobacter sp. LN3S78 TaxID=3382300 RepID=UPI00387AC39E
MKHRLPGQVTRILLFSLLALQLGACSSTRLSYQFADRGVVWWVEDYVDLTGTQEDALLQDLRQMREWHCQTQLPRYSDWLAELRRETARGELPPEHIRYHRQQLAAFLEPLSARAVPVASRLLKSLTDEQVRELVASMEEQQAEYRREYLDEDTPQEAVERVVERTERWLGDLNDRQVAIIRQWLADREGATEAWLDGRGNWQAAFSSLLEQRRQADFEDRLRDMIIHYQRYQGEAYQARAGRNADDIVQLTHKLLVAADDRHWRHLQEETSDLRQDMVALACPAEPATAAR